MADKLAIYKGALRLLGNAAGLSSLTEVSPARYALDDIWTPAVEFLLAKGLWNFAMRSVRAESTPSADTEFGYTYVFDKPDDWVRTGSIDNVANGGGAFEDYKDRTSYWLANVDTLYIDYVSNDEDYGWNIGAWRQPFAKALEAYMAFESGLPIAADRGNRNDMYQLFKTRLQDAKTLDAVDERVQRRPAGRLTRARGGMFSGSGRDG